MFISQKKNIGILGGTFDPPHSGHFSISKFALTKLSLDEIWWIVVEKNPLKNNPSDLLARKKKAKEFVKSNRIKVFEISEKGKTIYAIDIISYLKKKFPHKRFIWLMGVDGLEKFHLWKDWKKIFCEIPIAIFDRPFYSLNIIKSRVTGFFKDRRIKVGLSNQLKYMRPPAWVFINGIANYQSSTKLRSELDEQKK